MDFEAAIIDKGAPHERRLAAVVFTDVVGYSAMIHADEAAAIDRVGADLARLREQCARRGGECLNSMGDGLMLAFPSVVVAVAFALAVQEEFAQRNETLQPVDRLQHRIGIHLGDVFRMADGLLAGDGVNIASRLEAIAPAGGICISQSVHDMVKGKLEFQAVSGGARTLKNIAEPISVWLLHPRGEGTDGTIVNERAPPGRIGRRALMVGGAAAALMAGGGAWVVLRRATAPADTGLDAKSIAVLPFQNMSDDKDTSYFADGIHEDLLTQLALFSELKVVSRTSVMEYRNTAKKVPQIGGELKVASLVEGSVRRAGNVVRVTAQLIDAHADRHLWAANYDRDLKDIFKVQSELATEIARSLNVSLSAADERRLAKPPTSNLQAYDIYLRHQELVRTVAGSMRNLSSVKERIVLLKQVVALDPSFALAWAKLAAEHARAKGYGFDIDDDQKHLAQQAIAKALALAPDDLQVKIEKAVVQLHGMDDQEGARRTYEEVLDKVPYNVGALDGLAEVFNQLIRTEDSVRLLETAHSIDSRNAGVLVRLAGTYGNYRHYDRALALRKQVVDMRPNDLDVRAGYERWLYYKTGSWASFDAWRSRLPEGIEKRVARVRNVDADRAIARGDFNEVHRLIEMDSEDFKQSLSSSSVVDVELRSLHALAWNASGDIARAANAAVETIRRAHDAIKGKDTDASLWEQKAYMHALLREREAAFAAFDKAVALTVPGGNQFVIELTRRRRTWVECLLGDREQAMASLKRQSRSPSFYVHEVRLALQLAPLWKDAAFIALVADPATNAPLPLNTPLSGI